MSTPITWRHAPRTHEHSIGDVDGLVTRLAALEYDSGWRDITDGAENVPTSGRLYIMRRGGEVHIRFAEIVYDAATSLARLGTLPLGFRPSLLDAEFASSRRLAADTNVGLRVTTSGNVYAYRVEAGQAFRGGGSWPTGDPIPTSLPGAPA